MDRGLDVLSYPGCLGFRRSTVSHQGSVVEKVRMYTIKLHERSTSHMVGAQLSRQIVSEGSEEISLCQGEWR